MFKGMTTAFCTMSELARYFPRFNNITNLLPGLARQIVGMVCSHAYKMGGGNPGHSYLCIKHYFLHFSLFVAVIVDNLARAQSVASFSTNQQENDEKVSIS